jgi:GMP synthase-like glutamine amidotransferase
MKLAILEAGTPPGPLTERFGRYPAMFERLLGNGIDYDSFDVPAGELPGVPGAHDAYLITGAAAGVYDGLPWIHELAAFLRAAGGEKLVGICFGHQIMAEAFGGRVEKVAKGWGVGLHDYPIEKNRPWMDQHRSSPSPPRTRIRSSAAAPTDIIASLHLRLMPGSPGTTSAQSPSVPVRARLRQALIGSARARDRTARRLARPAQ